MILKKLVKEKTILINIKIRPSELKKIRENAEAWAGGNLSEWLRFAGIRHKPSREELTK
jgi:hypothetical protein